MPPPTRGSVHSWLLHTARQRTWGLLPCRPYRWHAGASACTTHRSHRTGSGLIAQGHLPLLDCHCSLTSGWTFRLAPWSRSQDPLVGKSAWPGPAGPVSLRSGPGAVGWPSPGETCRVAERPARTGYLPQDPYLFSGTIRDNILLRAAARQVQDYAPCRGRSPGAGSGRVLRRPW